MRSRFVALALAVSSAAASPASAQENYEVVRLGDIQMSCEALVSDINTLRVEITASERRAREGAEARQAAGRVGRGLLSGLVRGAAAMGYGGSLGDGPAAAIASQAIAGVASELASGSGASAPAEHAPPQPQGAQDTPRHQRLAHLSAILTSRSC